jgi:hypothetical protein
MQATTATHTAEVDAGVLRVHALNAPLLRTITPEGETVGPLPPSLSAIAARPVFAATYMGDRHAEVDVCAGFQRWHGSKSLVSVRRALGRCGFDRSATDSLLKHMKREQADCPHYYR